VSFAVKLEALREGFARIEEIVREV
jgi:hypothetical protein